MNGRTRQQYAALPFIVGLGGRLRVMLLTSRETRRWVIPKGWPEKELSPAAVAVQEAYEEAGLVGALLGSEPVGLYRYGKRLNSGKIIPCKVRVFLFEVERQLKSWPEKKQRKTRWFSPKDAAARVDEVELAKLIKRLRKDYLLLREK